ncbi:MAG: hypothetical protein WBA07_22635 [Rivularia sp. (in: cyanobacteria)]
MNWELGELEIGEEREERELGEEGTRKISYYNQGARRSHYKCISQLLGNKYINPQQNHLVTKIVTSELLLFENYTIGIK